jgi:peroxiredoxin
MKVRGIAWLALAVCAAVGTAALAADVVERAVLDKPVADFTLRDLTKEPGPGEKEQSTLVTLSSLRGQKNVVLFFMSEKCRVTWRYERRVGKLMQDLAKKDVAFFAVRCSANDTPESIVKFAEAKNFAMPVLNDEKGAMTHFYGVTNTPTFVLIDKEGILRYRGGFDDNPDESAAKQTYLVDAAQAVLGGKEVPVKSTRALG